MTPVFGLSNNGPINGGNGPVRINHRMGLNIGPNSPSSLLAHRGNFLSALQSNTQSKTPWIIDSGASDHMTSSHHLFSSYSTCAGNLKVKILDGSLSSVAVKGSIKISDSITFESFLHVLKLSCNLLSTNQLMKNANCFGKFFPSYCLFQDISSGKTIDSAKKSKGLYNFDETDVSKQSQITICDSASVTRNSKIML